MNNQRSSLLRKLFMPVRRAMLKYLSPITESKEFKALYPVFVISVGAAAVAGAERFRTVVFVLALLTIVSSLVVIYAWDAKKISLECRWNLLFFSYYRPILARLTRSVAPHIDGKQRLDVNFFRTHDLEVALRDAGPDFEQVSGSPVINIMSFDIEYLPLLKVGIPIDGTTYKLTPLSHFWSGRGLDEFERRLPATVRNELLARLERTRLIALPIGWGLVGVLVTGSTLERAAIIKSLTNGEPDNPGFSFDRFFEEIQRVRSQGYSIFCYDFWSAMVQLLALGYTGHMTVNEEERSTIENAIEKLAGLLKPAEVISDPVVLLSKVKEADKCVVVGGASWFDTEGDLLAVDTPGAGAAYGAFCECVGLLAAPEGKPRVWMDDAVGIFSWLADNLATGDGLNRDTGYRSIMNSYFPGLEPSPSLLKPGPIDLFGNHRMEFNENARRIFRQLPASGIDPAADVRELWEVRIHGAAGGSD